MATNKHALIRYKTIDKCLQNKGRKWTLNDLIEACSDALYEYEGKDTNVSKRTVQADIQLMRSDKLGYEAPIEVYEKRYYRYQDEEYSITDIPLGQMDMNILHESMEMLRQFKDFSLFSDLNGVIQKLEDKIFRESNEEAPIIHMDSNENLKGLEHLDTLYQAILKKVVLKITYQSFKAHEPSELPFHPYLLREYNNRWFIVGKVEKEERMLTLALDRIANIDFDLSTKYKKDDFNSKTYYQNTIGVTVLRDRDIINVTLKVNPMNAPYVLTKPFHHSQELLEQQEDGSIIIKIRVHQNFELERLLLGFGESIEIITPKKLRDRLIQKYKYALRNYE